jgi:hypothetical protein
MITNGANAVIVLSNPMNVTLWTVMDESVNRYYVCRPGQDTSSIVRVKEAIGAEKMLSQQGIDAPFGRRQ